MNPQRFSQLLWEGNMESWLLSGSVGPGAAPPFCSVVLIKSPPLASVAATSAPGAKVRSLNTAVVSVREPS